MQEIKIHAANDNGRVVLCGDKTPGQGREPVDKHPEYWHIVNCEACLALNPYAK